MRPSTPAAASAVASAGVVTVHDADYRVNAWTVTTPAEATALAAAGVDGLIADTPGVLSELS